MTRHEEKPLLYAMMATIGLSTLLCLIGLTTPGWGIVTILNQSTELFVFSRVTRLLAGAAGPLAIVSLLLLIACLTVLGFFYKDKLKNRYVPVGIVGLQIMTTFFLLATFSSFFSTVSFYSVQIMISAFAFSYLASIIGTYWLASIHGGLPIGIRESSSQPVEQQRTTKARSNQVKPNYSIEQQ